MAEQTLIDAMAKALYEYDEDFDWKDAPESSKTNCRRYAGVMLRSILDHGPTPAMVRAAAEQIERVDLHPCGENNPDEWWMQWQDCACEALKAGIAAELEGGAHG